MDLRTFPKNKKGMGIGDLYPIFLTIALVAILLAVVLIVFENYTETISDDQVTVINETLGAMNDSSELRVWVTNVTACGFNNFAVSAITNDSDGGLWPTSAYSVDASTGVITTTTTAGGMNNTINNVTYTYDEGGTPCEAIADITTDFEDFIPWIGVILLIVAAAIVLGILIKNLGGAGGSSRV